MTIKFFLFHDKGLFEIAICHICFDQRKDRHILFRLGKHLFRLCFLYGLPLSVNGIPVLMDIFLAWHNQMVPWALSFDGWIRIRIRVGKRR